MAWRNQVALQILAFFLSFLTACPPGTFAADLKWGVNGHPFTAYPGISLQAQLDLVKSLGMTSYRVNVSSLDHVRPLADLAALGRERGIDILPVLTPPLSLERDSPDALYAQAFNFAVTIVSALKHHIPVWELGNELEVYAILKPCEMQDDGQKYPCSNGPASGVGALEYHGGRWQKVSAVLKGLSDGVVTVDPKLRKAIGTAGWGHVGAFERMQRDGIRWDISVWHTYQTDPEWILEKVASFKRPIWITEFNHPYGSRDGAEKQAAGSAAMIDQFRRWRTRFNIEAAHFYELLDEPYWLPDFEAAMGMVSLVKSDSGSGWVVDAKKPVFFAVQSAIARGARGLASTCSLTTARSLPAGTDQVLAYAHCLAIGRDIDEKIGALWRARMANGDSVTSFLLTLVDSDAFAAAHYDASLSHKDFIVTAFERFLMRKPDGGGLAAYTNELSRGGMRRRDVVVGIINSSEFRAVHPVLFQPTKSADGVSSATVTTKR